LFLFKRREKGDALRGKKRRGKRSPSCSTCARKEERERITTALAYFTSLAKREEAALAGGGKKMKPVLSLLTKGKRKSASCIPGNGEKLVKGKGLL